MKKAILILSVFLLSLIPFHYVPGLVGQLPEYDQLGALILDRLISEISAESILVGDARTGRIIYQKNAECIRPIASLTKIMTAIIVLENKNLEDVVKIERTDRTVNSWKLGLKKGHKITIKDLLLAFLLESRNDAALYAAEAVAKTEKEFVELMNKKAAEIGAESTIFSNCHGLDTNGTNFSTALDLFRITCYALKNPVFSEIVRTREADITWTGSAVRKKHLKNVNKCLFLYEGVDGVKTGYTRQAGRCIVLSCRRGGLHLICILLNSRDIWRESGLLLDFAFSKLYLDKHSEGMVTGNK